MIIITGQTATGKTKLALEYAKKYQGEIINCDSRQIYKYLDIITGKDLDRGQSETKIWLIDVVPPNQPFSSFDFVQVAKKAIADIKKRGKTPIIVGGTYLYLKHLLYGFDVNTPPDWSLRKELNQWPKEKLQEKLHRLDPEIERIMNQSDWQNPRRLIRRIEIYLSTNKSNQVNQSCHPSFFSEVSLYFGLYFSSKEKLKKAIEKRVEERLKKGAIDEVKKLLKMGYQPDHPGLKTIGYQQIIKFLKGEMTKGEAIDQWIKEEIQYAKRQLKFMKKDKNIRWIAV